ncbi:MAG TPA: hypothetical protein DC054_17705 [Blastocatellia bacterium]|nr:hypothetical protein [Blastocatellia bacterium]
MQTIEELRYGTAGIAIEDYERELDRLWKELQDPASDIRQEANERGINVQQLSDVQRSDAISLRSRGAAFGAEVTLIVALAPLAVELVKVTGPIIKDLWIHVLRPRILQKWGSQALPPKEDE